MLDELSDAEEFSDEGEMEDGSAHIKIATLGEVFEEVQHLETSRALNALSLPVEGSNHTRLLKCV